jgi:TRAP-type C4-dicarboxylate transport system permease large subunit
MPDASAAGRIRSIVDLVGELFKTPLPEFYRGVPPFLVIYMAMLMLMTYVPTITLVPLSLLK